VCLMKMYKITVFLVCCLLSSAVKAEAKILAKPDQAEQNLKLYQKSMETTELDIDEGSGEDIDEDDYDDYDDDDYFYDDEYPSGDSEWLPHEDSAEIKAELIPDDPKESDFHFKEDHDTDKNKNYDDLLYEYDNEYYYEDNDDYLDQVEQDLESENQEVIVTKQAEQDLTGRFIFQPSYIFLMLTSALISFAIFILAFILCRRSAQRHQKKTHMVPFIVSPTDFTSSKHYSSPIVKNYQRVPTSTKELMQHSSVVEMMQNQNQSERPLLT